MNLESNEEMLLKKQKDLEVNFYKPRKQRKVADDKLIRYQGQIKALKAIGRGFRDKYQKAETQVSPLNEKNADLELANQNNLEVLESAKNNEERKMESKDEEIAHLQSIGFKMRMTGLKTKIGCFWRSKKIWK